MNTQRLLLNIALALLVPAFIIQATLALFPEPRWEQFNKELPGYWYDTATSREKKIVGEEQLLNNRKFTQAQQKQQKKIFLTILPISILLIVLGALIRQQYLGSAFITAGIFAAFRSYLFLSNVSPDGQWFNVSMKWRALLFGIAVFALLAVELYLIIAERPKKKKKKVTPRKKIINQPAPDTFIA